MLEWVPECLPPAFLKSAKQIPPLTQILKIANKIILTGFHSSVNIYKEKLWTKR